MKTCSCNTKTNLKLLSLVTISLTLPSLAWSGDSCNSLLKLGLYNVTQSSSSIDAQSLVTSTFCSFDYSKIEETSTSAAAIKAAYGLFSGGASGSVSKQEIITKQSSVCTSGFDSSKYISNTTAYSKTVYQGSLDAWNKCQEIAAQNLNFNVQPSSTMQGVSVSISVPPGYDAWFYGVAQYGSGHSDCSVFGSNGLMNVTMTSPVKFNAASSLTVSCARQMAQIGNDFFADAQDLVFITSRDNLTVPLAPMGSLSRLTVDQINGQTDGKIKVQIAPITASLNGLIGKAKGVITIKAGTFTSTSTSAFDVATVISNTLLSSNPKNSNIVVPASGNYIATTTVRTCIGGAKDYISSFVQLNGVEIANAVTSATPACASAVATASIYANAGDLISGKCAINAGMPSQCNFTLALLN